jgi:hypothetical protein
MHTKLWLGNVNGRDVLKDLGVDERMYLREIRWKFVDGIHLDQDSDQ